jgi:hypothetical protein
MPTTPRAANISGVSEFDTAYPARSELCPTSAMGVLEKAAMMTTGIIILPVICIKRSGVDLARQHRSQVGDSRNVMELRRARLNRVFERLNRLLEDELRRPLSNKPLGNQPAATKANARQFAAKLRPDH